MVTRILGILALALFPALALAAPRTFRELADHLVFIMNYAIGVLVIAGLTIYLFGVATNIVNFGKEDGGEKRSAFFVWGIVILFVMVSIWGILALLQSTFFSGGVGEQIGQSKSTGGFLTPEDAKLTR
ncbi:hypothetical protein COU20_01170 [Candidatus Kaiserbacteria bacterium CG10_big_fil_rev_8_21_14_0_10_59_10]|uniref:Uncharacterized protein n=1 Tax=Candidatus Kaiserbacteria bacterium CG10_big_fil_rev_8_21_14_0_10_59_10 TaxID=1974612 RepID=A0A2H0UAB1_9BACT|nr:MAG: hypothetical protein COU20_01170 [Candidatus Kaiserbacteria bacterium CG10_big_fil_rev_8_21_14_0_10_59_10]